MLRTLRLVAMFLLFGTALTLRAQEIDGAIHLGDAFLGTVTDATDVDAVSFDAVKGDLVTVTAGPGKGSTLLAHVAVRNAETDEVIGEASALAKAVKLVVTIPVTGGYELLVSGSNGTSGRFKVTTKVKADKGALKPASAPGTGQPGSIRVIFDAPEGTLLSATISPAKQSDALPGDPVLRLGQDALDILLPYTTIKGSKLTIKQAPLPALGIYTLNVDNLGGQGDLLAKVALKRPSIKKKVVTESHFAIALDQSIALQTTCGASSFAVSGKVLDLTGEGLPASVDWKLVAAGTNKTGAFKLKAGVFAGKVPLVAGDNVITLSAGGIDAGVLIRVTYNPGYDFGGRLVLLPDVVYVNESKLVSAQIALTDPATDPASVLLVRVLPDGDEELVTQLVDTGDLMAGDEIQGDRVYSGRGPVLHTMAGEVPYRVVVHANGDEARSESFPLLVSAHLSTGELDSILGVQEGAQAVIDQAAANGTLDLVLPDVLAALQNDPLVAQAGMSDSGQGLWIVYESGIAGVLYSPEAGVKGGGVGAQQKPAPQVIRQAGASLQLPPPATTTQPWSDMRRAQMVSVLESQHGGLGDSVGRVPPYDAWLHATPQPDGVLPAGALAATAKNVVKSNKVFAIAAQFFDWGNADDIPAMQQQLANDGCFDVKYMTYGAKGAGSVEDFKRLGDYGVVLISSHGDSFYNGLLSLWKEKFGWNGPFGQVILHSNMKVTNANKLTYEDDLKKGRLVLWYGNYGITPTFIRRYTGSMPNSLVYMSICRGTFNGTLAQAFLAKGAGAYLGYSDYVAVSFCQGIGPPLLTELLKPDKTMADAFIPGLKETDGNPAEFFLFGSTTLALEGGVLNDGNFEAASVHQSWSTAGDARVIPYLGEFSPTEGNWMGIISTGLGYTTSSGSLKQTFCLSSGATGLSFDWNFISEEFVEYCGSIYQDYFTVSLRDTVTNESVTLLSTWVDALCGDVFEVGFGFDKGDAYATGWNGFSGAIPASMQGHKVELTLAASDVGDSIFDTAILIDDIQVVE